MKHLQVRKNNRLKYKNMFYTTEKYKKIMRVLYKKLILFLPPEMDICKNDEEGGECCSSRPK
jgi:hypothetical protein